VYKKAIGKFKRYAINIWNVDSENKTDDEIALEGIEKTKEYFSRIGSPVTLTEIGIKKEDIEKIADTTNLNRGSYVRLTKEVAIEILEGAI
ncbi:MAG: iron-containing alcohol dehydrogenase, partial [Lachnospiraceae bacterium]|nr:iron-containing alcohol dehydrogenase [Lachnospiraceae bacterium]